MKSRITKLAAAAVIIIAVLIGVNQFGGSIDGANVAFAEVIQQIREARTVTFTTEIKVGKQVMRIENTHKEPGLKRALMPGGLVLISDLARKKSITINHSEKQYTERDLENVQTQDFFEDMRTLPNRANEILAKKEMDGHIVQGFRVIEHGRIVRHLIAFVLQLTDGGDELRNGGTDIREFNNIGCRLLGKGAEFS